MTVKTGSEDASRSIGAYQVTTSWTETEVTWNRRKIGKLATTGRPRGGDLGSKLDDATVSNRGGHAGDLRRDAAGEGKRSPAGSARRATRIAPSSTSKRRRTRSYRGYVTPERPQRRGPAGHSR